MKNKKLWLFVAIILLYAVFKIYVLMTPDKADDNIPDAVLNSALDVIS